MNTVMNRRSFVAGTTALGTSLAGAAAFAKPAQADEPVNGSSDWLGAAPSVSDDQIVETVDTEVLVIGGGLSGLTTLNAAVEEGASCMLIEKYRCSRYGGIYHSAIGYKKQLEAGVELDPRKVLNEELLKNGPLCDASHWANWAYKSGDIMDWLIDKCEARGVVFALPFTEYEEGVDPDDEPYISIPGSFTSGWDYFLETDKEKEQFVLDALTADALEASAEIRYNTAGICLVQDDNGAVVGAIAEGENGYIRINASKGVIVCTGDFAGNKEMCDALLPSTIASGVYDSNAYGAYMDDDVRPTERLDTGDGHRMCLWAGGSMEDNPVGTMGWPTVPLMGIIPYMGVNSVGERFCNEANAFMIIGRLAYDQACAPEQGPHFWKIVDSNYQEQTAEMRTTFMAGVVDAGPDEEFMASNVKADTIADLAAGMGVDPDILQESIDRYNACVEAGVDTDFGKPARYLKPIVEPPFYAVQAQQLFVHTVGGVICTPKLEVSGADGPIAGLYAAGNVVGKRFGTCYEASLPGMSNAFAIVHGYLAAKSCAAR